MNYEQKKKFLQSEKKEAMKRDFKSSNERKSVVDGFKREFRSAKRAEKNKIKRDIKRKFGV